MRIPGLAQFEDTSCQLLRDTVIARPSSVRAGQLDRLSRNLWSSSSIFVTGPTADSLLSYHRGMHNVVVTPIGWVRSEVKDSREDQWGSVVSLIELDPEQIDGEAVTGLTDFSHVEVLFHLSQVPDTAVVKAARHPRNNPAWPKVGILAQRGKARPNRIAATICELVSAERSTVTVRGLDAFDGSPVLDVKPVFAEFVPQRREIRQPRWSHELMAKYF